MIAAPAMIAAPGATTAARGETTVPATTAAPAATTAARGETTDRAMTDRARIARRATIVHAKSASLLPASEVHLPASPERRPQRVGARDETTGATAAGRSGRRVSMIEPRARPR